MKTGCLEVQHAEDKPPEKFHIPIQRVLKTLFRANFMLKHVQKTSEAITFYKTHRRCQFKIGSKSRLQYNMKGVWVARDKKDIAKLDYLQCSDKMAITVLSSEI